MTHPAERHLAQAERRLALARALLPKALANLELLMADGYGAGRHLDDPTGAAGLRVTHRDDETIPEGTADTVAATGVEVAVAAREIVRGVELYVTAFATEADGALAQLVKMLQRVPDVTVDTAKDADALRCSGGEGDWADPTCTKVAVRNVRSEQQRGTKLPVCWACLKRRQRKTGTLISDADAQPSG